jgi:diguanylate cyclase (GGDEF)-like protein/PAS domain S-box-containing protein
LTATERYRRIFEESPEPAYVTTRTGAFTHVNNAMCELVGWGRHELLGMNALTLYADPAEGHSFQKEIAKRDDVRSHELKVRTRSGRILDCLLSSRAMRDDAGGVVGYQGVIHDITDRKHAERQLIHNAFHDPMTGLPNRALFMDRLERLIRHTKRHREFCYAVLFLDLDRFKLINDSFGHLVGDELLNLVARRLQTCIRQEDTVARLGGDEFGILLDAVLDVTDATRVAERIAESLSVPFEIEGHEVSTSASVGITLSSVSHLYPEDVLRDADTAMYRAKAIGTAQYEVFDKDMHAQVVALLQLETDMRRALDRAQFEMHYQPIVNLETEKLVGFEALIRWLHPELGVLYPKSFLRLAEDTGLIVPLGWEGLRTALRQLREWQQVDPHLSMSVNLSARQILQPDFVDRLGALVQEIGTTEGLELDITERVFMENADTVSSLLMRLRGCGIRLCIDDFGTGYSSLSYLQRFSIDSLKIDRSFVSGVGTDGSNLALVNTISALARNLGIEAIAEGVETREQLAALRAIGTRFAQGFLISPALEARAASAFLSSSFSFANAKPGDGRSRKGI